MAGIGITSGFEVNAAQAIDDRIIKDSVVERDAIPSFRRYVGLTVYVTATDEEYRLVGGTADINWTLLSTASVSVSTDTTIDGNGTAGAPLSLADGAVTTAKIQNSQVTTIKIVNDGVDNTKLANLDTNRIKGRISAGTGDPEDLTPLQVRSMLNIEDGATGDQTATEIRDALQTLTLGDRLDASAIQNIPGTDLGITPDTSSVDVSSSTGTGITIQGASGSLAGVMSSSDKTKLDGIETAAKDDQVASEVPITTISGLAATQVQDALAELKSQLDTGIGLNSTNLTSVPTASTVDITSSTGTDATILAATTSLAGVMSSTQAQTLEDSASKSDVQNSAYTYASDTGSANAYTIALIPAVTTLQAGQSFSFLVANANTGASTLAVNGLTATSIVRNSDGTALQADDLTSGSIVNVKYDGTSFRLMSVSIASTVLAATQGSRLNQTDNSTTVVTVNLTNDDLRDIDIFVANVGASTSTITYNLPASPVDGRTAKFVDFAGEAETKNITISGSGNTINGASDFVIDTNYGFVELVYDLSLDVWVITDQVGGGVTDFRSQIILENNLDTTRDIRFTGPFTFLDTELYNGVTTVTYETALDGSSPSFTAQANITAVNSWITTNVTLSTTKWILRVLANPTKQTQVDLIYQ